MTFRKAQIDPDTNIVLNVVEVVRDSMTEIDGKPLIPCEDWVGIGDSYDQDAKGFTRAVNARPEVKPEPMTVEELVKVLDALGIVTAEAVEAAKASVKAAPP